MKSRKFYRDIINHCYQRTADGGVLFYTTSDHLVYFTMYCIVAKKYGIKVFSLCQMPDHVHDAVAARNQSDLVEFKRELNSRFARDYNKHCVTTSTAARRGKSLRCRLEARQNTVTKKPAAS